MKPQHTCEATVWNEKFQPEYCGKEATTNDYPWFGHIQSSYEMWLCDRHAEQYSQTAYYDEKLGVVQLK